MPKHRVRSRGVFEALELSSYRGKRIASKARTNEGRLQRYDSLALHKSEWRTGVPGIVDEDEVRVRVVLRRVQIDQRQPESRVPIPEPRRILGPARIVKSFDDIVVAIDDVGAARSCAPR